MTYQLIETKTLGTAVSTIEFTSIPQTFTDLVLVSNYRTTRAAVFDQLRIRFNGNTGANYTWLGAYGSGSSAGAENTGDDVSFKTDVGVGNNATANTFSNGAIYIANYTGSTNKSVSIDAVGENNATEAYQFIYVGTYTNTTAITSIQGFSEGSANFVVGSTFSLYGILKGSDGIVTTS
jgi:hypothetical protein